MGGSTVYIMMVLILIVVFVSLFSSDFRFSVAMELSGL